MSPHEYLEKHVAGILRADPWFTERRVNVIEQNSDALGEELRKAGAEVDGISLIISYDRERSMHSNPPQLEVDFSLLFTEFPATNRQNNGWASALDAAFHARKDIEAADRSLIHDETTHSTPGYGMLVATSKYRTRLIEGEEN